MLLHSHNLDVPSSNGSFADVVSAHGTFALNLYNTFALHNAGQNFLMSPLSIFATLAMIVPGARESTLHQILDAMSLKPFAKSHQSSQLYAAVGKMLTDVMGSDASSSELLLANKVFVESGYAIRPKYLATLRKYFGAEVIKAEFAKNHDTERKRINKLVEALTKGKISDLLVSGAVTPLTRLVLVNAIFFKANWSSPFDPRRTSPMAFETQASAAPISVPTMHKDALFPVFELPGKLMAVRFDFSAALDSRNSGNLSLHAILPTERHRLDALMSAMTPNDWLQVINSPTEMQRARVSLPKLQLSGSAELSELNYLPKLGIRDLFGNADLSGIASTPEDLSVTSFAHKAVLAWDELGAEGAAATTAVIETKSKLPSIEFNQPFLVIVTKEVGVADSKARQQVPIFVGRVSDPSRV